MYVCVCVSARKIEKEKERVCVFAMWVHVRACMCVRV